MKVSICHHLPTCNMKHVSFEFIILLGASPTKEKFKNLTLRIHPCVSYFLFKGYTSQVGLLLLNHA